MGWGEVGQDGAGCPATKKVAIIASPTQLANSSQPPALADSHVTQDPQERVPQNHALLGHTRCSPGQPFYQTFLPQTLTKQLWPPGWAGDTQ